MNFNALSLDQSTTCTGYSIYNNNTGFVKSGFIIPEGETTLEKISYINNEVEKIVKEFDIKFASLEGIWLNSFVGSGSYMSKKKMCGDNVNTVIVLGRLLGSLEFNLKRLGIERVKVISPMTWKAFYRIRGANQKQIAIVYANKINPSASKEDECEAILMGNYFMGELMKINEKDLRANEFKVSDGKKVYPHIFCYWEKKHFNEIGNKLDIRIPKECKVIVGKNSLGKNKWSTEVKELLPSELSQMNKASKLVFMQKLKEKGFRSDLARLVFEEQLRKIMED